MLVPLIAWLAALSLFPRLLFWAVVAIGHVGLGLWLFNRLGSGWLGRRQRRAEAQLGVLLATPPAVVLGHAWWTGWTDPTRPPSPWLVVYGLLVLLLLVVKVPEWLWWRWRTRGGPACVMESRRTRHDLSHAASDDASTRRALLGGTGRLWGLLPGNELLSLAVEHKRLRIKGLPPACQGLTITHLSDLHLTGDIDERYFSRVFEHARGLRSDLVMVTGDVVDRPECLAWLPRLFAGFEAPLGVYFVLGNHDLRAGTPEAVRRAIEACGPVSLGGRSVTREWRGARLLLAGNELPWFEPAPMVPPGAEEVPELRILAAHTPDLLPWARRQGFHVMLAGHTHGGQVQFPWIGPIVAPSRFGIRYAAGVFDEPPTVLHVSRGISGLPPVRYGCPPELTQLVLEPVRRPADEH